MPFADDLVCVAVGCRHLFNLGRVFATVTRNMFELRSLVKRFRLCCDDVIVLTKREPKFVIGYAWFQDGGL